MGLPDEARVWCRPDERVTTGKAYREILTIAAAENVELIVMGVHGMGPLHVRLFGSTTLHIIREVTCPSSRCADKGGGTDGLHRVETFVTAAMLERAFADAGVASLM